MGLHAIVPADKDTPPGVIFVLKIAITQSISTRKNRLHPFYMVSYHKGVGSCH